MNNTELVGILGCILKKKNIIQRIGFLTPNILENTRKRDMLNVAHKLMPTVWKTSLLLPWDT